MRQVKYSISVLLGCCTLGAGLTQAGEFTKPKYNKSCSSIYNKTYLKARSHKAFVIYNPQGATGIGRSTICWSTDTTSTKKIAISHALAKCNALVKRRIGKGECRLFAAD